VYTFADSLRDFPPLRAHSGIHGLFLDPLRDRVVSIGRVVHGKKIYAYIYIYIHRTASDPGF